MKTLIIRQGQRLTIRAIAFPSEDERRDKCPALAFFQEQAQLRGGEMEKLAALLTETANHGPPPNERKFKDLPGTTGLYEFKTSGGLRLLCFWDEGSLIICTHGYLKDSQKAPKSEIARAERLKRDYQNAKKNQTLHHVPSRKR
jgi:hypothetical protein